MCRLMFAALAAIAALSPLQAQQLPARDLFRFPIGTLAEPAALANAAGGGFWNPATLALRAGQRSVLSVSALTSPVDQGVSAQLATAGYAVRPGITLGASLAHASVGDLLRTDTDPLSIGSEIPYRSTIVSASASAAFGTQTYGLAVRRRTAAADNVSGAVTSVDAGVASDRPRGLPVRIGAGTFLGLSAGGREQRAILGAAEGYLPWSTARARLGLAGQWEQSGQQELFLYGAGSLRGVDLRAGVARERSAGNTTLRPRLGLGVHHAQYTVAIAREEGASGLGASYQFLLTSVMP